MNRYLLYILGVVLLTSSCRKNVFIENGGQSTPCVYQLNLPDSVGQWRIDTFSLPTNDRYNKDIFFLNENVGFLLKDYYSLFKTTDGGKTWAKISSFYDYEITYQVYFINENVGFVSVFGRPNARLLTTIDGGLTWENRILPIQGTLSHIQFTDEFHGFALHFGFKNPNQSIVSLYETKNQGRTWAEVKMNDTLSTDRLGLQFLDDKKAFTIAMKNNKNYLLKSLDGGLTWKVLGNLPENIFEFKFTDEQNGILTTFKTCFTTTDGGLTWKEKTDIQGFTRLLFAGSVTDFLLNLETIQCNYGDYGHYQSQFLSIENNDIKRTQNVTFLNPRLSFFPNKKLGYVVEDNKLLRFTR